MRLFVAMDIPEEVRRALQAFVAPLAAVRCGARWARLAGVHVTLKFIGEVGAEKVDAIRSALRDVRSAAAVEMKFRGTGFFPDEKRPRVFWAGIEASANLAEIAAGVERRLEPLGIAREQRAFKPHLTLARFEERGAPRDRQGPGQTMDALRAAIAVAGAPEFGACTAREFHLYESKLQRGGAVYTRLETFPLS